MKILLGLVGLTLTLGLSGCFENQASGQLASDPRPPFVADPTPDFVASPGGPAPFPQGADTLFIGHSFFVPISQHFDAIVADSDAYPQHSHQSVFSGGKSGTPGELWDSRSKRQEATSILARGKTDLLAFTHGGLIGSSEQDYQRWIDLALIYNPNTAFMIGSLWSTGGTNNTIEQFRAETKAAADYGWWMTQILREANPGVAFYHVAHGPMMVQMREDFEAGELEDITRLVGRKRDDDVLFTDSNLGHAGTMAKDLMALVWLHELYGTKPGAVRVRWDTEDTARLVREVVTLNTGYN